MEKVTGFWWVNLPTELILKFKDKKYSSTELVEFFNGLDHEDKIIIYVNDPLMHHVGVYEYLTNYKHMTYIEEVQPLMFRDLEWIKTHIDYKEHELSSFLSADNFIEISRVLFHEIKTLLKLKEPAGIKSSKEIITKIATDYSGDHFSNHKGETIKVNVSEGKEKTEPIDLETPIYTENTKVKYNPYSIKDSSIPPAFRVETIAAVFAEHIKNFSKESGQMLCVTGKWGRGKTYFVKEVCNQLGIDFEDNTSSKNSKFHFVRFHAWKYQNTPAIWAYLYEVLLNNYVSTYLRSWRYDLLLKLLFSFLTVLILWLGLVCFNPVFLDIKYILIIPFLSLSFLLPRIGKIAKVNYFRKGWLSFSWNILIVLVALGWSFYFSLPERIGILWDILTWSSKGVALGLSLLKISSFLSLANKPLKQFLSNFSSIPSFQHVLGFQSEIQRELIAILKAQASNSKRLLLFIDDLDRCSENRMIEIVDALRVMLEDPEIIKRMIVLVAVDETKLKKAVRSKYKELYDKGNGDLKRLEMEYLDKLFISGIKLGALSQDDRIEFFKKIIEEDGNVLTNERSFSKINTESIDVKELGSQAKQSSSSKDPNVTNEAVTEQTDSKSEVIKELNDKEKKIFVEKLKEYNDLSPRQIRIIYYRYRLGRNLWARLNGDLNFPSEEIVSKLFSGEDKETVDSNSIGASDIIEMIKAY